MKLGKALGTHYHSDGVWYDNCQEGKIDVVVFRIRWYTGDGEYDEPIDNRSE